MSCTLLIVSSISKTFEKETLSHWNVNENLKSCRNNQIIVREKGVQF